MAPPPRVVLPLAALSRRDFCRLVVGGAALVPLGCGDSGSGDLGAAADLSAVPPDLAAPRDLSASRDLSRPADLRAPEDLAAPEDLTPPSDYASANGCPGDYYALGMKPADFILGTATFFNTFNLPLFICRDPKGLYGMGALCTHEACTVSFTGSNFSCPCHGSQFTFAGDVMAGPALRPLEHFALCVDKDGNLGFDSNTFVPAATRSNF